jgi:two-component system, cell cycle sensor histidine kinase and response regulator CckA
VVMNLCLNAVQATTPPGRVEVMTEPARLDEDQAGQWDVVPGEYARLRVRDFGKGMDEALMERIFEPFFTTRAEGRGMGLSVTLGIIRSHRGHIEVESSPGKGTTMTVWLPAALVPKGEAVGPAPRSRTAPLPRGCETLLVIDDDPGVRRTVDTMLASLGYCVVSRGEPEEALASLENNAEDFNLVLLDANLPRYPLTEMYDRIRALCPRVPVLLASGFDPQEQCAPIIERGAAGFVQKPFSMATLATQVRAALDGVQK